MAAEPLHRHDDDPTDGDDRESSPADESIVSKVRKLLAMAEGSTNPNEADAFAQKAAELIVAHRIDPERLAKLDRSELTVAEYFIGRGAYVRGRLALLQAIAEAQGCEVVFQRRENGTVAMVAGFRSDLRSVDLLYQSLHTQATARMAGVRRRTPAATQQWRRSFLFGFANQLKEMFEATQQAAVEHPDTDASTLPVLAQREERVHSYARQQFGRTRTAKPPAAAHANGYKAGRRAAANADIGRKRLTGFRSLGRGA